MEAVGILKEGKTAGRWNRWFRRGQEQLLGQLAEVLIRRALLAGRVFKSREQFMLVRGSGHMALPIRALAIH